MTSLHTSPTQSSGSASSTSTSAGASSTPAGIQGAVALAEQFTAQGMRVAPGTGLLWCTLCTTMSVRAHVADMATASPPTHAEAKQETAEVLGSSPPRDGAGTDDALLSTLVLVAGTRDAVMTHCATRAHLLSYEALQERGLSQWCHVELNNRRVLLDHHCVYPAAMYGPGRMVLDHTIAGGMLLATDVCGGVKLWPRHRYEVVEMLLPAAHSTATCTLKRGECLLNKGVGGEAASVDQPQSAPRLVHTVSGRPQHLRQEAREGRSGSGWARWRVGPRSRSGAQSKAIARAADTHDAGTVPCDARTTVLPAFVQEVHGVHGARRWHHRSASHVLQQVNKLIRGEATERVRRRRRLETRNVKENHAHQEAKADVREA